MRIETTTFTGPFAENIKKYINEKKIIGCKYENYVYVLKSFDTFSKNYNKDLKFLTKDLIHSWLDSHENDKQSNLAYRANQIRGFSKYMNIIDKKSYILPKGIYNCHEKYNAYIYSKDEIRKIFFQIDKMIKLQPNKKNKNYSSQIIFRLLYMCGLRISEALNLKIKDYNQEEKLLIIRNSKKDKDRIIPINNELNNLIVNYIEKFHVLSDSNAYIFKGRNNEPFTRFTIYKRLRVILKECGIEHSQGEPNLHSFRHTFSVHCLKKWVLESKDLMVYLPILQTYLGHDSLKETAYYLKLTADIYPNIIKVIESRYNELVPEVEAKQ